MIGQLQARSVTVFFSSHLLYEIEPICDRVAILHDGRIVVSESVDALRARVKRVELQPREPAAGAVARIPALLDVQRDGDDWALIVADIDAARGPLEQLSRNGVSTSDLNLDEIFEAFVAGRKELPA